MNLDDDRRGRLAALLRENPELGELLEPAEPSPVDRALEALCLVRSFDEALYAEVFRESDPGLPPFDDVVSHPDVECVPRTGGKRFWLRDAAQTRGLAAWERRPDDRAVWDRRVYEWLSRRDADPSAALALLFRLDFGEALRALERHYERADQENDLVTCHALVEQVQANLERVPTAERLPFQRFVARYRARALFLKEFHRSAEYFPRPAVEKPFREIRRADSSKWIMFLTARGGMGKTMFIHRLIAHELLKTSPYPLIVRLDLDDLEVASLADVPWLVAIEIAEQLDPQLPQPLFRGGPSAFADVVAGFKPLLYKRQSDRARLGDVDRQQLMRMAREQYANWSVFHSRCTELPKDRPLVVFIDTLEEATLHHPAAFRRVLERFEELHRILLTMRLVLSGRYEPDGAHFPQYDDALRAQTRFERLEALKDPEARAFIARFLPEGRADDVVKAMVETGRGNPFMLAMLCEVVKHAADMDAATIREYKDAEVAYLIKRVIERIPANTELGLRWLLRYGAVPRRLTFSFVQDALLPLLKRALSGEIEVDEDDIPTAVERTAWLKDATVKLDPVALWADLTKYASVHSWISVDSGDPNTLSLHPDVVIPMRRLLKGQHVYGKLHQDAAAHFARLRQERAERWLDFTLAELYHRAELGDEALLSRVQAAFGERPTHADAALRRELARELIRAAGDFGEASPAVRAWAHYEAADAMAIMANFTYLPLDEGREEISRSLDQAAELGSRARIQLPSFMWRWRECLASNHPNTRSAVINLVAGVPSSDERLHYWLLLLDLFGQGRIRPTAISTLALVFALVPRLIRSARIPGWVARERFAAALLSQGKGERGIRILRDILGRIEEQETGEHVDRVRAHLIDALVSSLDLAGAEGELARFPRDKRDQRLADQHWVFQASIHLWRRDAWSALECAERIGDRTDFRYELTRGNAFGQLLRVDEALRAFALAREACLRAGRVVDADRILLEETRFRLFEAGMPVSPLPRRSPEGLVGAELELIRAYQLRDKPPAALGILESLTGPRQPLATRARALCAGVSWGLLPGSRDDMDKALREITPTGARLALTRPPVLGGPPGPEAPWGRRPSLRMELEPKADPGSEGLVWLLYGRVLRAMGDERRAARALARIGLDDVPTRAQLAVFRQRRLAECNAEPDTIGCWDGVKHEPALYAAVMIENAERALRDGELDVVRTSLARAGSRSGRNVPPAFEARRRAAEDELQRRGAPGGALPAHPPAGEERWANFRPEVGSEALPEAIDAQRTARTEAAPAAEPRPRDEEVLPMPDYRCLVLATEQGRLAVDEPGQRSPTLVSTTDNESLAILCGVPRERSPRRLIPRFVASWPQSVEELREPLMESPSTPLAPGAASAPLFLVLTSPALVAVPWEVAIPASHSPIRVGRGDRAGALVEEIRRPEARDLLTRYLSRLARSFPERPRVTAYAPSGRDSRQLGELQRLCASRGLPFDPAGDLRKSDVIFVHSPLRDSPSLPEPSLPGGATGEMLGREIARARGDGAGPLVILQVPGSPSPSETVEQLFARNQFAQALVNSRSVSGVLATGLCALEEESRLTTAIVESLRDASTAMDILHRIRRAFPESASAEEMAAALGSQASALFLSGEGPE